MCGRVALTASGEELVEVFGLDEVPDVQPRYNIAPSQKLAIVRAGAGRRTLGSVLWGLVPAWAPEPAAGMINARAETAARRATFREPFRHRRCLVPASGFYEWKREGSHRQPFFIKRKDGRPMALAGLWDRWEGHGSSVESCAILTTEANELVGAIHDRMPVILPPEAFADWLDSRRHDVVELARLLGPAPMGWLEAYPVSTLVNKPEHDRAECLAPVAEASRVRQHSLF